MERRTLQLKSMDSTDLGNCGPILFVEMDKEFVDINKETGLINWCEGKSVIRYAQTSLVVNQYSSRFN